MSIHSACPRCLPSSLETPPLQGNCHGTQQRMRRCGVQSCLWVCATAGHSIQYITPKSCRRLATGTQFLQRTKIRDTFESIDLLIKVRQLFSYLLCGITPRSTTPWTAYDDSIPRLTGDRVSRPLARICLLRKLVRCLMSFGTCTYHLRLKRSRGPLRRPHLITITYAVVVPRLLHPKPSTFTSFCRRLYRILERASISASCPSKPRFVEAIYRGRIRGDWVQTCQLASGTPYTRSISQL